MSFYDFMLSNYLHDATAEGDLAGDMKHEQASFPRSGGNGHDGHDEHDGQYEHDGHDGHDGHDEHNEHDEIQRYLLTRHACPECMDVFENCWKEYMRQKQDHVMGGEPNGACGEPKPGRRVQARAGGEPKPGRRAQQSAG